MTQALLKAYQHIRCGDPLDPNIHMGPLINEDAVKNFEKAMQEIKANGGKILIGGKILSRVFCRAHLSAAPLDLDDHKTRNICAYFIPDPI